MFLAHTFFRHAFPPANGAVKNVLFRSASTVRFGLIKGDGAGNVTIPCAQKVLSSLPLSTDKELDFVELTAGYELFRKSGVALPTTTITELKSCAAALFGSVNSPKEVVEGYRSPIIELREKLNLFASLRPVEGVTRDLRPVDMLVVRENTENYMPVSETRDGDTVTIEREMTKSACLQIANTAYYWARWRARRQKEKEQLDKGIGLVPAKIRPPKVTIVHKANVLPVSDGLFLEVCREVGKREENQSIITEDMFVDSAAHELIRNPETFDVILTTNFYGDILSDMVAALVGGLGVVPTANINDEFILAHGSNIVSDSHVDECANPLATIRAAALCLVALGEPVVARAIDKAVLAVMKEGPFTPDMGGIATAADVTKAVIKRAQYFQFTATMPGQE